MKSIIVNNNFWKKAMFINILAIFIVVLLVLIEQIKTEGVVGIAEGSANNERKVLSTRISMAKTTEPSANETKINETVQGEMLMLNNNGQKIENFSSNISLKNEDKEDANSNNGFKIEFSLTVTSITLCCLCYLCICICCSCCN